MFGRALYTYTARNANPATFKSIEQAVLNGNFGVNANNVANITNITTISAPNQSKTVQTSSYSTQSKKFTITEKKIEELRQPHQPTSPHLTVYKFPLAAVMSIMHRATGICLGLGIAGVAGLALFAPHDPSYYIDVLKTQYPMMVYPVKFAVALPLLYHFATGVRHIIWDETVKGITTKQVNSTGVMILGFVGISSLILTFFTSN